jgi:hypothetical protein
MLNNRGQAKNSALLFCVSNTAGKNASAACFCPLGSSTTKDFAYGLIAHSFDSRKVNYSPTLI